MLKRFEVTNFSKFNETLVLDLASPKSYEFNQDCIHDGIVKTALVYGKNASGKSSLGLALFDFVEHLTDFNSGFLQRSPHFLNAFSKSNIAKFTYTFQINNTEIVYTYEKDSSRKIQNELLIINKIKVIDYCLGMPLITKLIGTESLDKNLNPASNLSALKYIEKNANLSLRSKNNKLFLSLMSFVNNFLFFRNVTDSLTYIGLKSGRENIYTNIIKNNNVTDFEKFLNECGIDCQLGITESDGENTIGFKFPDKTIPISIIGSTGTKGLALFYFWWQQIKLNKISFLFIDEFDTSYHYELSSEIVKKLKIISSQVILTTHDTSLLSNDLIRPDCGFILNNGEIKSLNSLTDKDLRNAHNLEKLYRSGAFNG